MVWVVKQTKTIALQHLNLFIRTNLMMRKKIYKGRTMKIKSSYTTMITSPKDIHEKTSNVTRKPVTKHIRTLYKRIL